MARGDGPRPDPTERILILSQVLGWDPIVLQQMDRHMLQKAPGFIRGLKSEASGAPTQESGEIVLGADRSDPLA